MFQTPCMDRPLKTKSYSLEEKIFRHLIEDYVFILTVKWNNNQKEFCEYLSYLHNTAILHIFAISLICNIVIISIFAEL